MKTKIDNTTEPQHDAKLPVVGSASRFNIYIMGAKARSSALRGWVVYCHITI